GIVKPSDKETVAVDTFRNRLVAEIHQAVTSVALWHQWGGLAINTTFGNADQYTDETEGADAVFVRLLITFRTPENDPYTVAA
ncbi:MAG: hypothetical protein ACKO0Z_19200, partial [Betaproteobacteria bacterium]